MKVLIIVLITILTLIGYDTEEVSQEAKDISSSIVGQWLNMGGNSSSLTDDSVKYQFNEDKTFTIEHYNTLSVDFITMYQGVFTYYDNNKLELRFTHEYNDSGVGPPLLGITSRNKVKTSTTSLSSNYALIDETLSSIYLNTPSGVIYCGGNTENLVGKWNYLFSYERSFSYYYEDYIYSGWRSETKNEAFTNYYIAFNEDNTSEFLHEAIGIFEPNLQTGTWYIDSSAGSFSSTDIDSFTNYTTYKVVENCIYLGPEKTNILFEKTYFYKQ